MYAFMSKVESNKIQSNAHAGTSTAGYALIYLYVMTVDITLQIWILISLNITRVVFLFSLPPFILSLLPSFIVYFHLLFLSLSVLFLSSHVLFLLLSLPVCLFSVLKRSERISRIPKLKLKVLQPTEKLNYSIFVIISTFILDT